MLHVSDLLLQHRDVATFEELIEIVKLRSRDEMFFRMDLKPPYPDTPNNWEMILEAAFNSPNEAAPLTDPLAAPLADPLAAANSAVKTDKDSN